LAVSVELITADVLLAAAVAVVIGSALGVLLMRGVYRKAHLATPISVVAPTLVAIAVTVREGWTEPTAQTWLAVGILAVAGPALAHATVRAARIRERGDWRSPSGSARRRQAQ
jgi:multisubunit Na+/H+ antiporter MnhG subunit